jgi:hypothetical protein
MCLIQPQKLWYNNGSKTVSALNETSHLYRFSLMTLMTESATEKEAQFIMLPSQFIAKKTFVFIKKVVLLLLVGKLSSATNIVPKH